MKPSRNRTVADLGETETLARVRRLLPGHTKNVVVGFGDDAAVLRPPRSGCLVVTADALREGVHFPARTFPWRDIGYKAVMVNASDIVAMGGKPTGMLVTLGVPGKIPWRNLRELYLGFLEALRVCDAELLGGDLDRTDRLHVEVTMQGSVPRRGILRIDGAGPEEWIYVTGTLGDSRAGLLLLVASSRKKGAISKDERVLVQRHFRPPYRYEAMRVIRREFSPTALVDLSDGLARDVRRLCTASGVGCRIELETLPVSAECFLMCERTGEDPRLFACRGGEDYQLLFTSKQDPEKAPKEAAGIPVTTIGRTRKSPRRVSFELCGLKLDDLEGYEHFRTG